MQKRELKELASVTTSQLVAAANILGFGDQPEYSDEQAQAILDYLAPKDSGAPHLPTQSVSSEQSTGLAGSLLRVADGVNTGFDGLMSRRDQFVEETALAIAHEIATIPAAIEARVFELLQGVSAAHDASVLFPAINQASDAFDQPLQRRTRVERKALNPANYAMITASCSPH